MPCNNTVAGLGDAGRVGTRLTPVVVHENIILYTKTVAAYPKQVRCGPVSTRFVPSLRLCASGYLTLSVPMSVMRLLTPAKCSNTTILNSGIHPPQTQFIIQLHIMYILADHYRV